MNKHLKLVTPLIFFPYSQIALNLSQRTKPIVLLPTPVRQKFSSITPKANQLHTKTSLKDTDKKLKPFVKWAGGKTQFLEIINS